MGSLLPDSYTTLTSIVFVVIVSSFPIYSYMNSILVFHPEQGSNVTHIGQNSVDTALNGSLESPLYSGHTSELDLSSFYQKDFGENVSVCVSKQWIDMPLTFDGVMYLTPKSNLDEKGLKEFLGPLGPIKTIQTKMSNGIQQVRFFQRRQHRIETYKTDKPVLVLPSWCRMWPYPNGNCDWPKYNSAILREEKLCFWPKLPTQEGKRESDDPINATLWASKFESRGIKIGQVMIAGGFFGNIWHAAIILNTWCNVKHQDDLHFLVQSNDMSLFVPTIAKALGIRASRIIHHTGPVLAESVFLAPYYGNVDWSCLHATLSRATEQEFLVVYFRGWDDPSRNIPEHIHHDLVLELSGKFPELQVKTFSGNETFEEIKDLFRKARLVIGPHGAGMVNLIFCQAGTPVIEFTVPALLNRPWQAMGAMTFGLTWWPVLLKNFSSSDEIRASVSVVQHALELS